MRGRKSCIEVRLASIANFVCSHDYWLNIDEVYKNVPDKKPTCK